MALAAVSQIWIAGVDVSRTCINPLRTEKMSAVSIVWENGEVAAYAGHTAQKERRRGSQADSTIVPPTIWSCIATGLWILNVPNRRERRNRRMSRSSFKSAKP